MPAFDILVPSIAFRWWNWIKDALKLFPQWNQSAFDWPAEVSTSDKDCKRKYNANRYPKEEANASVRREIHATTSTNSFIFYPNTYKVFVIISQREKTTYFLVDFHFRHWKILACILNSKCSWECSSLSGSYWCCSCRHHESVVSYMTGIKWTRQVEVRLPGLEFKITAIHLRWNLKPARKRPKKARLLGVYTCTCGIYAALSMAPYPTGSLQKVAIFLNM